jgi:hypothetical protein
MAKNLARILKTDLPRLPLKKAAEELRKKGRGRDTVLAHITPREAAMLKARGGSGTINPDTGLPEFDDTFGGGFDWFSAPTYEATPAPMQTDTFQAQAPAETVQAPAQTTGPGLTPQELGADAAALQADYNALSGSQSVSGVAPGQELWGNYFNTPLATYQANLINPPSADANIPTPPVMPTDIAAARSQYLADTTGTGEGDQRYITSGPLDKETTDRMAAADSQKTPAAKGIQTPFGTLGLKEAIAALGIGGMGLNYLRAQQQGKAAAQQLQNAYNTAAAQSQALAQPYMQQGGTQLAQALTGALSPVQQQQLAAGQAAAAQQAASSGGVAAAQAGRSVEDLRQRLLSNQQTMALQLLGAGTPLISNAINQQLQGTTTGINTQMQLSQQAGQAATGMLSMLGALYGRG